MTRFDRSGRFTVWFTCAMIIAAVGVVGRASESIRIVPLVHDDEVLVSVELRDAYTDDVRAMIASGLRTTFTYDVELRTVVPAWVDRTIAAEVVTTSDRFDNLTRRHNITRMVDGRVEDATVTDDDKVVKQWLTTINRLSLCHTNRLDANRDYYVRITARARPHRGSLLEWANAIRGQAKFTFVP